MERKYKTGQSVATFVCGQHRYCTIMSYNSEDRSYLVDGKRGRILIRTEMDLAADLTELYDRDRFKRFINKPVPKKRGFWHSVAHNMAMSTVAMIMVQSIIQEMDIETENK